MEKKVRKERFYFFRSGFGTPFKCFVQVRLSGGAAHTNISLHIHIALLCSQEGANNATASCGLGRLALYWRRGEGRKAIHVQGLQCSQLAAKSSSGKPSLPLRASLL